MGEWIPIKYHEITPEEREQEGYPKDWAYHLDCKMPDDHEEIWVTVKGRRKNYVRQDTCFIDGEYYLDSGYDWLDVLAWMPMLMPEPYKKEE